MTNQMTAEAVPATPKVSELQSVEVAVDDLRHELDRMRKNAEDLLQTLKYGNDPAPEVPMEDKGKRERGATRLKEMHLILNEDCLKGFCVEIGETLGEITRMITQKK